MISFACEGQSEQRQVLRMRIDQSRCGFDRFMFRNARRPEARHLAHDPIVSGSTEPRMTHLGYP